MKVIIFTMNGGNGTFAPSIALRNYLRRKGCDATVIDIMARTNPLGALLTNLYNDLQRRNLVLATLYMDFAHTFPVDDFVPFNHMGVSRVRHIIEGSRPTAIILTCPWISKMALSAIRTCRLRGGDRPRVYIDVVDLGARMPRSWINNEVDYTFIPTEDAYIFLKSKGLKESSCEIMGLPISEEFSKGRVDDKEKALARKALGIGSGTDVITILGGREGMRNTGGILHELVNARLDARILAQCGMNSRLEHRCRRICKGARNVRILGYVESMRELIAASDIVITKPGASTTSELIVSRVPFILDTWPMVMPQERGNVAFVKRHGFGVVAMRHSDIPKIAIEVLEGKGAHSRSRDRSLHVRRSLYGTERIGDWIISSLKGT